MRFIAALLVMLLACVPSLANAAVTFDAAASSNSAVSDVITYNHTLAANANLIVVVAAYRDGASSPVAVTSVTVGGVAATLISGCATNANPATTRVELWGLVSPPTGVQSVVVDMSGGGGSNDEETAGSLSFIGAATTSTFGTCVLLSTTTANADMLTVGSAVGEMVVAGLSANAGPTCTADATAPVSTERFETAVAGNVTGCAYTEDGATSVDMQVDLGSSQRVAGAAVSIRALAAAASRSRPLFFQ